MRHELSLIRMGTVLLIGVGLFTQGALADDLTQRIQNDLVALGYEPGNTSGEATTDTVVAIAKFQAEQGLDVNGQVSPILAGILSAEVSKRGSAAAPASAASASAARAPAPVDNPVAREEARQACLETKIAEAQKSQRTRRGLGRLASAVSRVASRAGNNDVSRAVGDAGVAVATVDDLSAAARDLGITDNEIDACNNAR
jgi:hypothetical protein